MKKVKEDRRKSQGLLSFVLQENYIGDQMELGKDTKITGRAKLQLLYLTLTVSCIVLNHSLAANSILSYSSLLTEAFSVCNSATVQL